MKQETLELPLAGSLADLRDRLAEEDPKWGNRPVYTCYCCGATYPKGSWSCCGPRAGQASQNWAAEWHEACPTRDPVGPGKRACPRHCACPRDPKGNLPRLGKNPSLAATKEFVHELRAAAATGVRRSSLNMDESEWPDGTTTTTQPAEPQHAAAALESAGADPWGDDIPPPTDADIPF